MQFLNVVVDWVTNLLTPMFTPPDPTLERPKKPLWVWVVHFLVVLLILGGLYWLHQDLGLNKYIRSAPNWLAVSWLPMIFLIVYLLVWTVSWTMLWSKEQGGGSDQPEIDEAMNAIVAELKRAGIGIQDTPLYVVLGPLETGLEPIFRKLPRPLEVSGVTPTSAPLRCFANREAIYLCLQNISLIGRRFIRIEGAVDEGGTGDNSGQSIGVGQSIGAASIGASVGGHTAKLKLALDKAQTTPAPPEEVRKCEARLAHVARRLTTLRAPLCPINGVLLCVSVNLTTQSAAEQLGLTAQRELAALRQAMAQDFSVTALVGDLSIINGSADFLKEFDKRDQRLGRGFALQPDRPVGEIGDEIVENVAWVFDRLFPYLVYKQYELPEGTNPTSGKGTLQEQTQSQSNGQLYHFMHTLTQRGPLIGRLVARAVSLDPDRAPIFGGCYLDDSHPKAPSEKSMTTEFFRKFEANQGAVAWIDEAFARDAAYHAKAIRGYTVMGVVSLVVVALGVYVLGFKR